MSRPRVAIISLSLILTTAASAQTLEVAIPSSRQHEFRSKETGRDYRLFVSLPESYTASDTVRYTVLYVLDGNGFFGLSTETHRLLRLRADVPELIIVGIGYPVSSFSETSIPRWWDYTPSADPPADSLRAIQLGSRARGGKLHSGGGPQFVAILRDEIIPFIEASYRTTRDRGLFGDSLGGLLAAYILVTTPELFSRYALSSPSLWWNNGDIFAREAAYFRTHPALNARLFLSVGGDEEKDRMVAPVDRLARILDERHYVGLIMSTHVFEGEDHVSVGPAAVSRSMRFLYSPPPRS
jgi:predicted alpha/beta superfamily hydrolase